MKNLILAAATLLFSLPLAYDGAAMPDGNDLQEACRALADLRIEDTNLLSATVVSASSDLPEYCRVLGYVRPAINVETRLPTSDWNGYMAGCGGFCGTLDSGPNFIHGINRGLERGYAARRLAGRCEHRAGRYEYYCPG